MTNAAPKLLGFKKRWEIPHSAAHAFEQLRNRLGILVRAEFARHAAAKAVDTRVAFFLGYEADDSKDLQNDVYGSSYTTEAIRDSARVAQLAYVLECLFLAFAEDQYPRLPQFVNAVQEALDFSPSVGIRVVERHGSVLVYRSGAKLLDEGIVNDVLGWLKDYPEAASKFRSALTLYMQGSPEKQRNLLDDLRLGLELLLRGVLHNKKSLENQKLILLPWLEQRGLHQQVINMYETVLFGQYATYQNDAVKHGEKYSNDEIEFMIYLTGTFMRHILQLSNKKAK